MSITTRKLRHTIAAGSIAALAAISLAACSGGDAGGGEAAGGEDCTPEYEFETIEPGVLTLATYDYPPATVIESDSSITGFEGDILTEFAERNCLALNVTSAGGAGAVIPSIETARADIGAGSWYRTDDRAEVVRLSNPTIMDSSAVISTQDLTTEDLDQGYVIGSVSGNLWNDSMSGWLGDDFVIYQDEESIYGDLEAGRIDAIIASAMTADLRFESNPIEGASVNLLEPNDNVPEFARPGQINFPSTIDNDGLGDALDETIEAMREDGTLLEIMESYNLDPSVIEIDEIYNL